MSRRLAAAAGALAIAVFAAGAAAAPPQPRPCIPGQPIRGNIIRDTKAPETICGTRGHDRIYISGRDSVWAFQGNDVVYARNRKPDQISGGLGRDTAYVDRIDTVRNVERVIRRG